MLTREFMQEGVNDPNIFKAVFMAGAPGSGKTYVARKLGLQAAGLRTVNSDEVFEYLLKKHQLDPKMPPEEQEKRDIVRQRAKQVTSNRRDYYLENGLGMIIDGTAKDYKKIEGIKFLLEGIGYQTMMIFVNTSLSTALERNRNRERSVPDDIVKKSHAEVQKNVENYRYIFQTGWSPEWRTDIVMYDYQGKRIDYGPKIRTYPSFIEVFNDADTDFTPAYQKVQQFLRTPLKPHAQRWVNMQRQRNLRKYDYDDYDDDYDDYDDDDEIERNIPGTLY